MGRVDHDTLRLGAIVAERHEDLVEHPKPAPAHEAVVERLVRPIGLGRILPLQAVADHIDNPAYHTPVIDTRHPMGQRKMW